MLKLDIHYKTELRPGTQDESASPAFLAASTMNTRYRVNTSKPTTV